MRCPYLREAQVKFCRASAFRKMIVRTQDSGGEEKCVSPDWASCDVAKQHCEERPSQSHCLFLHEMLVQYCSISPVRTFVPYSDSQLSRCANEGHRYCEAFMTLANAGTAPKNHTGNRLDSDESVGGFHMPAPLSYTRNHMWLDLTDDQSCHVGIDAFLAHVIGMVDRVTFVTTRGRVRPVAVLTVGDVDLQMIFPNEFDLTGINMCLRTRPEKIAAEPYRLGWLFKGVYQRHPHKGSAIDSGLLCGTNARDWMVRETGRLNTFVHDRVAETHMLADGGTFARGFIRELNREAALRVYNEFFSLQAADTVTL